ncbi:DUF998 domain-containing protein [Lacticaseibacillus baoqingensis]|uniref:DUF998 domain-containing protein n=1 Tax=Lacticaseibacillus baoqingensis TaxID=2486013 RepID=A0ABW4EBL9_9LACO|nr:DUF998 domain-containing protein [Lacticaseibacillus baoqingensis]
MAEEQTPLHLKLPKAVCAELGVDAHTPMQLRVKNNQLVIQPRFKERVAGRRWFLLWPVILSALLAIGVYGYWWWQGLATVPLSGGTSVASFVIGIGSLAGWCMFAGFFVYMRRAESHPLIYWRNFPVILIAFAVILGLALIGGFWVLGQLFPGAAFDRFTAALIFWVFTMIATAFMVEAALTITAATLSNLLTVVIVTGVVIAMAANNHRRWWQHNLSFLGTDMASNAWQFNLTLIMSALLMIALIDTLFVALAPVFPRDRRLWLMRGMLTLVAVDLAGVGLFPNNAASHLLHDQAAGMLVFLVAALIIGCRWLLPGVSKAFLTLSYGVAVLLLLLNFGFRWFGYPSLTSFEIQAFALAFGWLLLLFSRLQALVDQGKQAWTVVIQASDDKKTDVS